MQPATVRLAILGFLAAQAIPIAARSLKRDVSPVTNGLASGWAYKGCYTDSQSDRTLDGPQTESDSMTVETCVAFCTSQGYPYAGLEYYSQCFCGSSIDTDSSLATDSDCNTACSGNGAEACGGADRISIYSNPNVSPPTVAPGSSGYCYIDCYSDSINARALAHEITADLMTAEICLAACSSQGYAFAGLEYGSQCFCGNSIDNGNTAGGNGATCDKPCQGNSKELCGGAGAMNLYGLCSQSTTKPVSSSAPKSSAPAPSSSAPAPSSSAPAPSSSAPAPSSSKPAPAPSSSAPAPAPSSTAKPCPVPSSTAKPSSTVPASSTAKTTTTPPCNPPKSTLATSTTKPASTTTKPCSQPTKPANQNCYVILGIWRICF